MGRDRRSRVHWALLHAQKTALNADVPLAVVFCLVSRYQDAVRGQIRFMLDGLKETEKDLLKMQIPMVLLKGSPEVVLPRFRPDNGF